MASEGDVQTDSEGPSGQILVAIGDVQTDSEGPSGQILVAIVILSQIFFFFPKGRLFADGTGGTGLRGGSGDPDKQDRFGINKSIPQLKMVGSGFHQHRNYFTFLQLCILK
jgi:hypothetical protein